MHYRFRGSTGFKVDWIFRSGNSVLVDGCELPSLGLEKEEEKKVY